VIIISDTGVTPGRVLRRILEADALAPMIDGCVFSDEIGAAKPAPAAFHAARLLSGCDSPSRWHVGDNLDTDIAGALNLHIPALHLAAAACPAHHDSPGYHWVSSLSAAALLIAAA
jgi:putative hydrolase of the HAD superfamily